MLYGKFIGGKHVLELNDLELKMVSDAVNSYYIMVVDRGEQSISIESRAKEWNVSVEVLEGVAEELIITVPNCDPEPPELSTAALQQAFEAVESIQQELCSKEVGKLTKAEREFLEQAPETLSKLQRY